jgi:hypothetical protein
MKDQYKGKRTSTVEAATKQRPVKTGKVLFVQ